MTRLKSECLKAGGYVVRKGGYPTNPDAGLDIVAFTEMGHLLTWLGQNLAARPSIKPERTAYDIMKELRDVQAI